LKISAGYRFPNKSVILWFLSNRQGHGPTNPGTYIPTFFHHQIDLVILDLIMPGIGGKNGLDQILGMDPSARVIIASGYSVDDATREELELKAKGYIKKPFENHEVLEMVRNLLDEK
jgi:DNA-binding NarL/FixJ family response regulator